MTRRIHCAGVLDAPCPFRHWWYAERREGRPVERCHICRPKHEAARVRINRDNRNWKRRTLADDARASRPGREGA